MPCQQGDLALLQHPASQELLASKIPARLAYIATDGTPRVIPIWYHWNGKDFVMASPPKAPKLKALAKNPRVSLTIDDNTFPHKVLLVRGAARLELLDGIVPEYAMAADRYFGPEQDELTSRSIACAYSGRGHGARQIMSRQGTRKSQMATHLDTRDLLAGYDQRSRAYRTVCQHLSLAANFS